MFCKKRNYCSILKLILQTFLNLTLFLIITNCTEPTSLPTPPLLYPTVLYGQVYNLSHPGPIPEGWIPPPYDDFCTVIVQDLRQAINLEYRTDNHGKFQISVPPGTYYLRVKESMLSSVTGPYSIREGEMLEAKAYFDNGMR